MKAKICLRQRNKNSTKKTENFNQIIKNFEKVELNSKIRLSFEEEVLTMTVVNNLNFLAFCYIKN